MMDSEHARDPESTRDMDAATAAQLLDAADRVSVRVNDGTDFRTPALIQGWGAAALFIYVTAFLLLFTAPALDGVESAHGTTFVSTLVMAILVQSQLVHGARHQILISLAAPLRGWKLWLQLIGLALFIAIAAASVFGVKFGWWVSLVVAVCITAPLGLASLRSAQNARGNPARVPLVSPRPPLSRSARVMTAGLGAFFGVAGAVTAMPNLWSSVANLFLFLFLLLLMIGWNARWGLPRLGSEWGQRQWVGYGVSFTLLVALTLVVATTSLTTPWVGVIGGILVALPLALSTLRLRRQR